ncbi:MAG: glycogen debranching enzyme GlgX [Candidatus Glassbacteria bacterium GWA2_58_10]|uniref:Glycogen debranching enzyme GlgX n=1 Tax=Candidatus Glassbacteria bacterium GWA2_58_10 TaxID=1817865 RepID=A0A1F5YGN7_9BACT|nr:MAG: glycogen debranching enzyme GlgX [Candidatus Glassbacteria bacterium GWA2_58_10]
MNNITVSPGHPLPLGATLVPGGCRLSLFSRHATAVWLQLYESPRDDEPSKEIALDPALNRTGDIWHIQLNGDCSRLLYLWRVDGPDEPSQGHRFDPRSPLLDPCARAVAGEYRWESRQDPASGGKRQRRFRNLPPKCLAPGNDFDWGGIHRPHIPLEDSIIYELHVRGFTRHPSSGVKNPGTFPGLIEKIGYLKELGVTAVELLPVHEFNENEMILRNPLTGEKLRNYWGYSPVLFYAPKSGYAAGEALEGAPVREFKAMVKAFHEARIEVILDVVFNHTAEGNASGPTLNFRGLDNAIYYILDDKDRSIYLNYSGCGNTLNCNHPVVRGFIRNCLRYWVTEMKVDGFRFDLASILGRDRDGKMLVNPPLVESIAEDPILRHVKIIAEAWDAGGAYQVGSFPGKRWSEWNGKYRDDVRRFWRSEPFSRNALASRITGSSDIYVSSGKLPANSINFITSHDGFTLNDLVSYVEKHNEANGEGNRDGDNNNLSLNCGVEGPSADPAVEGLRQRLIRSFLATLFLSQGVPMILSGDEGRRTQQGNNNAYCQDNEISWLDWGRLEENRDLVEFTRRLIAFRKAHPVFRRKSFFSGLDHDNDGRADIEWYESSGHAVRWNISRPVLAAFLNGTMAETGNHEEDTDFYLMFNSGRESRRFVLPRPPGGALWGRVLDTALEGDSSMLAAEKKVKPLEDQAGYELAGHACGLLIALKN